MTKRVRDRQRADDGRLQARPAQLPVPAQAGAHGVQALRLDADRDALLFVPATYRPDRPAPLGVLLHGANGHAAHGVALVQPLADAAGMLVLAPASRERTWDVILGAYGPDVAFLDQALAQTFAQYAVDPARIAVGGFSDGASYALSLGVANGDLFTHIIAFSPGFMAPPDQIGMPRIFISHGTHDNVLPIGRCSRRIVPQLREAGYDLQYHEFEGGHIVPPQFTYDALQWFTAAPAP